MGSSSSKTKCYKESKKESLIIRGRVSLLVCIFMSCMSHVYNSDDEVLLIIVKGTSGLHD